MCPSEPLETQLCVFEFKIAIGNWKVTNHQELIKLQQNGFKQGVKEYALRAINLLILLGAMKTAATKGTVEYCACLNVRQ